MPFIRNKEQLSIKKLTIKAENQLNTDQCSFVDDLKKTDLITGVYEGGFKLWECSIDLVQYLIDENVPLDGKSVLEVGCGHGLPGIFCSLVGKDTTVHYQGIIPFTILIRQIITKK
jgi:predicted nicotinamide N-methyase